MQGTILDIGCGAGIFSLFINNEKSKGKRKVVGIDPDKYKIRMANKIKGGQAIFKKEKWVNGIRADCVVLLDVLYLLSPYEEEQLLRKIRNILHKNGRVIINTNLREKSIQFKLTSLLEYVFVQCFGSTYSNSKKTYYSSLEEFEDRVVRCGYSLYSRKRIYHLLFYPHDVVVLYKTPNR